MTASPQTYELAKMLKHLRTAKDKADNLRLETFVKGSLKQSFKLITMRCTQAENEILAPLSNAAREILETQLLNMDTTAQIEGIVDMLLALPQQSRDSIEQYVQSVHKLNHIAL